MTSKTVQREAWHCAPAGRRAALLALLLSAAIGSATHAADTNNGGGLYAKHCIACHGGPGVGAAPGSPSFQHGQGLARADLTLMQVVRRGKNAMPAYQGVLTNRELLDVIAYMRTLH